MTKSERTRQMIVEKAATLFNEKGIAGTTIDDILAATKVAKGCLYGHFDTKESLAYESIDYLLKKLSDRAGVVVQKAVTAWDKVNALIDLYKDPLDPFIEGGCPMLNLGVESDDTNPVVRDKVKVAIRETMAGIAGILKMGIARGEFSSALKPGPFATKILAMLEGGVLIARASNDRKPMDEIIKLLREDLKGYRL